MSPIPAHAVLLGGAPAAAASLADTPNLYAWYDFTDAAARTVSGTEISALNDKGASGRNVAQATSTNRPNVVSAAVNGYDTAVFDGDDALIHATKSTWRFLHNAGSTCIVAVKRTVDTHGRTGYYGDSTGVIWNTGFRHWDDTWNASQSGVYIGNSAIDTVASASFTPPTLNVWTIHTIICDPTNGTPANRIKYAINGGSLTTSSNTYTNGVNSGDSVNYFALGGLGASATSGAPTGGFEGQIAHLVICDAILGTSDWQAARDLVNGYVSAF